MHQTSPARRTRAWAGAVLHRGGPVAAVTVLVTALLAAVLVPLHAWHPAIVLPLVVLATAAAVPLTARLVPSTPVPVWTAAATLAIAAGHGVWAALTRAEHVVLRRDAGSYAQFTDWIRSRHGLPVEVHLEAFGGSAALADPAFRLSSPAFYQIVHGTPGAAGTTVDVLPQFLLGAPAWFSLGAWLSPQDGTGGWDGLLVAPAVASGLAVLAFAGLAARLVGPRWAVLAAGVLALSQPVLHAARSTYSEPLALLLVAVAGALLVDAVRVGGRPQQAQQARRLALAAGAAAGLAGLVRVDALREVVLLLPVAAVLAMRRHPAARPLVIGALGGLAVAAVPALVLSYRYLGDIAGSLVPLVAGGVLLGVLSLWAVRGRPRLPARVRALSRRAAAARRLPEVAGTAVLALGVLLASRPLWLAVRQDPSDPGARVVADLQRDQGLPVDGGRTYAEQSLTWVSWYLGWAVVVAAWVTFAVLAARAVRWWRADGAPEGASDGEVPAWLGPAVVGFGSLLLTLYRPGITPDHPWADRRLVPVVLPAVVLAAVAGAAWLARWAGERTGERAGERTGERAGRRGRVVQALVAAVAVAVSVVPAWLGTAALAGDGTEGGEHGAVHAVCRALGPDDVVIALDPRGSNEWPQVVRGMCGNPAASVRVTGASDEAEAARLSVEPARRIAERIEAAGRRPVLLAAEEQGLETIAQLGLRPAPAVRLDTTEDQRWLTRRPDGVAPLDVDVWLAPWPA